MCLHSRADTPLRGRVTKAGLLALPLCLASVIAAFAASYPGTPYQGIAASVPGTIQAEDFDNGGEGVAYHDSGPDNAGGAYRQTGVDIEVASGGGYDVGWISSGEWLNYTINVASAGTYAVQMRVASPTSGAAMHVGFNNASNVWQLVNVPNTGAWQSWETVSFTATLGAGVQQMTLYSDTGGYNIDSVTIASSGAGSPSGPALSPYSGSPFPVPGTIEAENFDNGGEGVAYHDTTPGNSGGAYRQTDVDIEPAAGGGYDIGWIAAGEWLNYTMNVAVAGSYTVQLRVASPNGGTIHVGFNGPSNVWQSVALRNTGGWQSWMTLSFTATLGAGTQQMTLLFDTGGCNIDSVEIAASAATAPTLAGPPPPSIWQHQGIGVTGQHGDASYSAGTFAVSGSGNAIWTPPDSFHFVYQPLTGDGVVIARVASMQNTDDYAKAGVLMYETLDPTAAHVVLDVTPSGNIELMQRPSAGAQTNWIAGARQSGPIWLRLDRAGATITGSWSLDGVVWTTLGSLGTSMAHTIYVGLMVSSHNTGLVNTATFDNVSVVSGGLAAVRTVFLIVMENKNWSELAGNSSAPYLNNALVPAASHAANYFTPPANHPSLPNYLWLEAGTNFGIYDDGPPSSHHQSTPAHFTTLLNEAGISWRSYQEDIAGYTCPLTDVQAYSPRHNPMVYFDDVTGANDANSSYCIAHVRPYFELSSDLANGTVARYNFITPNLCHDMHDCAIADGDAWLSTEIPRILASSAYRNGGVIFIVWDEGDNDSDGPVGMLALSPFAKASEYSSGIPYTHSSLLRTLQLIFGARPFLGDASTASDLSDLFLSAQ